MRHDESTSNLVRHTANCKSRTNSLSMESFARGSVYNPHSFRFSVLIWIVCHHRPFHIVEDPKFVELLRSLNANVSIPSRSTLSRDIQEVFDISRQKVASALQVCSLFICRNVSHLFTGILWQIAPLYQRVDLTQYYLLRRHYRALDSCG